MLPHGAGHWVPTCPGSAAPPPSTAGSTGRPKGGTWARFLSTAWAQLSRQPWLTIDRCGNRLRYMDSRVAEDGANAIYALGDLATIQMTPPGHRSYIVFDANYEDYLAGFAQNCHPTPDLGRRGAGALPRLAPRCAGRHRCRRAETPRYPEELEADLGLAEGVLTGAVAKWNEACERGEDDFLYPMRPRVAALSRRRLSTAAASAATCTVRRRGCSSTTRCRWWAPMAV